MYELQLKKTCRYTLLHFPSPKKGRRGGGGTNGQIFILFHSYVVDIFNREK